MKRRSTRPNDRFVSDFSAIFHRNFDISDFNACVLSSGLSLMTGASVSLITHVVDSEVFQLLRYDSKARTASVSEQKEYYKRVSTAANELLGLLSDRKSAWSVVCLSKQDLATDRFGHGFDGLAAVAANSLPEHWHAATTDGLVSRRGISRENVFVHLNNAPKALAAITLLAERAVDECAGKEDKAGRKPDLASDKLFDMLACVFFASFGEKPAVGSNRTDPSEASLLWIKEILNRLDRNASRFCELEISSTSSTLREDMNAYVSLIKRSQALSDKTKADYLAAGWRRWRELDPEKRWREDLWCRDGEMPTEGAVPKWVAGTPI